MVQGVRPVPRALNKGAFNQILCEPHGIERPLEDRHLRGAALPALICL